MDLAIRSQKISKWLYIVLICTCITFVTMVIPVYADYFSGQEDSGYLSIDNSNTSGSYLLIGTADTSSYRSVGSVYAYWAYSPYIETLPAQNVTMTSARISGRVLDDGDDDCEVRFGYDTTSRASFDDYTYKTAWVDSYTEGSRPYRDITSLNSSQTYYFRAQIKNTANTITSETELSFTTASTVYNVLGLYAFPYSTYIVLTWQKASGSTTTVIRYDTDDFPSTPTHGLSAYSGTGYQCVVTGLTPGQTYYFTAWGYANPYSPTEVELAVTTTAEIGTESEFDAEEPTLPDRMSQAPDTSGFNLEPFTSIINWFNTEGLGMPEDNLWELISMIGVVLFGLGVYIKTRTFLIAFTVVFFLTMVTVGLGLVQGWLLGVEIVIGMGVWAIERYMQ